jgi:hypothetical protein
MKRTLLHKLKRGCFRYWNITARGWEFAITRRYDRTVRQIQIANKKRIFDLSDMD